MSNNIRPEHYRYGKYEPIDVIQDWHLDFSLGNVIKYIARCGKKEGATMLDDLKKAREYLDFEIKFLEQDSGVRGRSDVMTESDLREMYMVDDGR